MRQRLDPHGQQQRYQRQIGDHPAGMRQPDREQQRRRARAGRGMVHRVTVLPRGGSQGNQAVAGRLA